MVRAEMDIDHIRDLASSIAARGLLQPIVVAALAGPYDQWQLLAGAHRLAAAKVLKWQSIPASVREAEPGAPIKSTALVENICRRNMSLEEEVQALLALIEEDGLSTAEICSLTGKSRDWVVRRVALPQLDENIGAALFDGLISLSAAEKIDTVADLGIRRQILNEAIYGKYTLSQIASLVEVAAAVPSMAEAIEAGIEKANTITTTSTAKKQCQACGRPCAISEMVVAWVCGGGCEPPLEGGD